MAYEGVLTCLPGGVAGEDLSTKQFYFGRISTNGAVVRASTLGEYVDGVIQNDPESGQACEFAISGVSKVICGAAVTAGDKVQTNALGKAITAAAAATAASKRSTVGPFDLAAGATMIIDVNNAGNATATFDAAAGYVIDTTSYPCADQTSLTVKFAVDGGALQTVTFGTATTAAHIIAAINTQCVGVAAAADTTHVKVTSDTLGTGSTIAVTAGTSALTWNAAVAGTGDVHNIDAVTATEIETIVEYDTTAEILVNSDGSFTIYSPSTGSASELDFKSGTVLTPCGLSVEVLTGSPNGTFSCGRALESGTTGALIPVLLSTSTLNG